MSVIKFLSISPAHTTDVPAIIIIIKKHNIAYHSLGMFVESS